ncbi:MAG TPA: hypothetical protein VKP30_17855 [Polyangiaceae bacterium]|nr:hypothetical protein [Polyangiaceae bacterium]
MRTSRFTSTPTSAEKAVLALLNSKVRDTDDRDNEVEGKPEFARVLGAYEDTASDWEPEGAFC